MNDATSTPRRWGRRLALLLGAAAVLGVATLLASRWWLDRYLASEQFRQWISQKTSAALRVKGEFLPLHWSGLTAYSDGFYARGLPESVLQEIRLDQIRAELDWRSRPRRIRDLEIQRLNATLKTPAPPPAATGKPAAAQVTLDPIRIADANVLWPQGAVRRVRAVVTLAANGWEATGSGGSFVWSNWPAMKIGQFQIRSHNGAVFVTHCRLDLDGGGTLAFSGQPPAEWRAEFADVPVRHWLPADWRGRLTGLASGWCHRTGQAATGTVTVTEGLLTALPVLDRIALFTGTEQFRQVPLQKATTEFAWQENRLTLRHLLLESTGLLRVEGGCVIEQDIMAGEFDLGVAEATLRWLPGARGRVFTVERDGYRWTKVKVTGPLRNLREDLSGRLIEAAGAEVFQGVTGTLEKGVQGLFDLLLP
jgi:hypothetical protein